MGRFGGIFLGALMELGKAAVRERIVRILLQCYVECPNGPVDPSHLGKRKPKMNMRLWPMVEQSNRLHVFVNGFFRPLPPAIGDP